MTFHAVKDAPPLPIFPRAEDVQVGDEIRGGYRHTVTLARVVAIRTVGHETTLTVQDTGELLTPVRVNHVMVEMWLPRKPRKLSYGARDTLRMYRR